MVDWPVYNLLEVSPDMSDVDKMLLNEVNYFRCDVVVDNQIYNYSVGYHDRRPEGHHGGIA